MWSIFYAICGTFLSLAPKNTMSDAAPRKIAILIESTRSYARDLILGIARFQNEHRNWEIEFSPRGFDEPLPGWLRSWKGHGIIARIDNRHLLRTLLAKKVPVVDLRRFIKHRSVPQIGPDDRQAVQMVFELFRKRNFDSFAFVGPAEKEHPVMDVRLTNFLALTHEHGFGLIEIRPSASPDRKSNTEAVLRHKLKRLPSRTAILAANDDWGMKTLEACRHLGRPVPYDLVVAGIGNDQCLCELALPKLTSVDLNPQLIGYTAAEMLQKMMNRRSYKPPRETLIEPLVVVERTSTDMISVEDHYVRLAIQFIRANVDKRLAVDDVARHVHLSIRALENHFRQVLGHSVFQEILLVKMEAVKERLTRTKMPIKQIAEETGFGTASYLMKAFRKYAGETMKQYRKRFRDENTV